MGMRESLRKLIIRVTFLDFSSELVRLKVPSDVTDHQIQEELSKVNEELFDKEVYGSFDLTAETLLSNVVKKHPSWNYSVIESDLEWCDAYPGGIS